MSHVNEVALAIDELVGEKVNDRIEDAISESHDIASMKDDISSLEQKCEDLEHKDHNQIVEDVMLHLTNTLCNNLEDGYVMIKKTYLESLQAKKEEGQNWGRKPPFSFYKIMDISKSIDICYKRGTLIGLKEAMILLKEQEVALAVSINAVAKEIKELETEYVFDDQNK